MRKKAKPVKRARAPKATQPFYLVNMIRKNGTNHKQTAWGTEAFETIMEAVKENHTRWTDDNKSRELIILFRSRPE